MKAQLHSMYVALYMDSTGNKRLAKPFIKYNADSLPCIAPLCYEDTFCSLSVVRIEEEFPHDMEECMCACTPKLII